MHFSRAVTEERQTQRRRDQIQVEIEQQIARGEFFLTECLMLPEPSATNAREYLHGWTQVPGGRFGPLPQYAGGIVQGLPDVMLVHRYDICDSETSCKDGSHMHDVGGSRRHQDGQIIERVFGKTQVPGTDQLRAAFINKKLGNVVTIPGAAINRATWILSKYGWPIRDAASNQNNSGTVIEWRWLEWRAQSDRADSVTTELYNQIKARLTKAGKLPKALEAHQAETPAVLVSQNRRIHVPQ